MSRLVQIQGEKPQFPANACVHCLSSSTQTVEIVKVKDDGSLRRVDVPFCDQCVALRQNKTPRQIQFERLAVGSSIALALAVGLWVYAHTSDIGQWAWGALLGLLAALIVFGIMYMLIQLWARGFRSAETKAALRAVSIREFDWNTTLLEFQNEEYAERFARLNQPQSPTNGC